MKWGITLIVPLGDDYLPVEIFTLGWNSFEIMVDSGRDGSIAWTRRGWRFYPCRNSLFTTADFIVIAEILEEISPVEKKIHWLERPTGSGRWPSPPRLQTHWAVMMYPKWPKVRNW